MPNALEQLAEMVRRAEATATAETLETEIQQASRELRAAEERNREAQERLRDVKPARRRELDQIQVEEQQLKELIQKAAQFKSHLESSDQVEQLITETRNDLDRRRREANAAIETIDRELVEARRDLQTAMQHYQEVRVKLDRLKPELASEFAADDRIFSEADIYFPGGQARALEKEIEAGGQYFDQLSRPEQYAQMKIWIGRLRRLQASDLTPEDVVLTNRLFGTLVGISKRYEPGYIEAFRQDYKADWDVFVAEAQDELKHAVDNSRSRAESERQQREQQHVLEERRRQAREEAQQAIAELKGVIASYDLPSEGVEEFRAVLRKVTGYGMSDEELLRLVSPYRDIISEGSEFRALRRNLDRLDQGNGHVESRADDIGDVLDVTEGMKVMMIGGARREDVRRQLQELFQFRRLDWEDYEGTKPALLDSMEQRIRNRGVDLVLILKSFISHHVPERFRPLCQQYDIPCLMVEQGYGAAQITKTLRTGLLHKVDR